MTKRNKIRKCIICGTEYEYCPHCSSDAKKEPWHFSFHDESCFELYYTCSSYAVNEITLEQAYDRLDRLKDKMDLNADYSEFLTRQIQAILAYKKPAKRKNIKEVMPEPETTEE